MDPRTSTLESDVAAVHAKIEAIHANYATAQAMAGAEGQLELKIEASKNELNLKIEVCKNDLNLKLHEAKDELELKIERTKNELGHEFRTEFTKLRVDVRNWVLGTVIGLFVAFGGMLATMYNVMKP